jgi:FSR family fosmidomycin resistance protein-like MFS transporter
VGKSVMLEVGPVLTALVVAGRVGAAMTAELGTMAVTEQLDALKMSNIEPIDYLVVPRLAASLVMTLALAVIGVAAALAIVPLLSSLGAGASEPPVAVTAGSAPAGGWGIRDSRGFSALCAIGMVDNATRTGFLTFMPFMLISKDLGVGGVGLAFSLVFIGGAAGKFVCGLVADRVGVIRTVVLTEAATTLLILVVVAAPLSLALAVLIPLGIALNGTSSVLYGTVAELVSRERRSRGYGLYYTMTIGASALAHTIWGVVGDTAGVPTTLTLVGLVVLVTIPLCLLLRSSVAAPASA